MEDIIPTNPAKIRYETDASPKPNNITLAFRFKNLAIE